MNLMLRVSLTLIDIESQKAEGPGVLAPIDPDVSPFHEAIIELKEQLRRGASLLVHSCACPRDLCNSDKAGEIGDLRRITTVLNHGRNIVMDESLGKGRLETAWDRLGSGTCHFCGVSQFRDPKTRKALGGKGAIVADIAPAKREAAMKAGALETIDAGAPDAVDRVRAAAGGPVVAAIDFVGSSATARLGIDALAKGGKYIIVGLFGGGRYHVSALDTIALDYGARFLSWYPFRPGGTPQLGTAHGGRTHPNRHAPPRAGERNA